jgi:hypothetical protein
MKPIFSTMVRFEMYSKRIVAYLMANANSIMTVC